MTFPRPDGTREEKRKYLIALRSSDADREREIAVVLCSTDLQPDRCRPYEVQIDPIVEAEAPLDRATKVDRRWVFTVSKSALGPSRGRMSDAAMRTISLALFKGLQMD